MMLIEKVVKLLDDFHFNTFREYVRDTSLRSYYPLALIDVIDRNFKKEQTIEKLFFQTYGKHPEEEKEIKKLQTKPNEKQEKPKLTEAYFSASVRWAIRLLKHFPKRSNSEVAEFTDLNEEMVATIRKSVD